jgi:hypothetical protein
MKHITAAELKRMFISGYHKVREGRERINKINVFPVPDQDTGNNLTNTLKGIHESIAGKSYESIHDLKRDILDGALTSAAGNVGIIMTSFLNGFLSAFPPDKVEAAHIERGMKDGAVQSFGAIQDPKKGTILDVIQASADYLGEREKGEENIAVILEKTLEKTQEALKETTNRMEIYKKVSVVDAGAYGFVLFLEGFLDGLENMNLTFEEEITASVKTKTFIQILSNRYEVVSLLDSPLKTREEILAELDELGDSIDIAEANNKLKIHIHTDLPEEVIDRISEFGEVLQMRTYDMTKGAEEYGKAKPTIGLVADEGASLPLTEAARIDAAVVPFKIFWEKTDTDPEFAGKSVYEKMRVLGHNTMRYGWPRTSQPAQNAYYRAFVDQLKKYNTVLCLTISSGLSGAYNSAVQARKLLDEKDRRRVYIPDFRQAGGGQGTLLLEADRLIRQGMDMKNIIRRLETLAKKIHIAGFAADPKWLVEGGRVPRSKGRFLKILRLLMFHLVFYLTPQGKIGLKGFQWGRSRLSDRAAQYVRGIKPGKKMKMTIIHADNTPEVERFKDLIKDIPHVILYESILPPVLGIHTGPDSIIISYHT